MRWIRVNITDLRFLSMPNECPNCLDGNATEEVGLRRFVGIPLVWYRKVKAPWPFCPRCAELVTRDRKWRWWFAYGPSLLLLAAAFILFVWGPPGFDTTRIAVWLLLAAGAIGLGGSMIVGIAHRLWPKPEGCLSNSPPVIPIRAGEALFSDRLFGDFYFRHPIYVEKLVSLNDSENVAVKEHVLQKALDAWSRRSDSGGSPSGNYLDSPDVPADGAES